MKPVRVIDISAWDTNVTDIVTMGRREKIAVNSPATNELFYFKQSKDNYPHEFWSEIIASKYGEMMGFNVADYNIGINKEIIASISDSVISKKGNEEETLIHGQNFILAIYPMYETDRGEQHSFQLIEEVLKTNDLEEYVVSVIEMIVFDALIGNNDRHQQNWAFIEITEEKKSITGIEEKKEEFEKEVKIKELKDKDIQAFLLMILIGLLIMIIFLANTTTRLLNPNKRRTKPFHKYKFAPLFDNGSSLGREILENRIENYLSSEERINDYINGNKKGFPHIRWGNDRISHVQLIRNIQSNYPEHTEEILKRCFVKFNEETVKYLIENADKDIPAKFAGMKLSPNRKSLIFTLLKERYDLLKREFGND